jgi:hypothetical protein
MPESKNIFVKSKMNKDADSRLLPQGEYRDALNFRNGGSESSDTGAGENSLSNRKLTNITLRPDAITIGMYPDEFENKIYWFVTSDETNYVLEWDDANDVTTIILQDSRVGDDNVLGFDREWIITGVNVIIDSDNGNRYLAWTDGLNPPRQINIERAKNYGENNFNDAEISVIKAPPLNEPTITLLSTATQKENNLKEKFLRFSYRFKYLDGEYSAISPFSPVAFNPKIFSYDFNKSSNESMVNVFNGVDITINTGSNLVTDLEIIAKEDNTNALEVIETFNKFNKGWADDINVSFIFLNDKKYRFLASSQLTRLYDNVPLKALSQEVIANRLVYGAYTENYNIEDCEGVEIFGDYTLDFGSEDIPNFIPKQTMKSNRDYEAVLVYGDSQGRITTGIESEGNSRHVPIGNSITSNYLTLEIGNKAPCFAEFYRVFIKESKREYETIVPTLFFFKENFIYFYIQPADVNKVRENEFIIVKADTEGIKDEVVKLKVLEIERQEEDFISESDGGQPEGLYLKTSILNEDVRFDTNSYSFYRFEDYDQSENSDRISGEESGYSHTIFKGALLDDLTATVSYTGTVDLRYEVEILFVGAIDKYRFRTQDTDGTLSSWDDNSGLGYDITGTIQTLDADVDIQFGAVTGHSIEDRWLIKKNVPFFADEDNRSYAAFSYSGAINIGSIINMKYYSKKENSDDIDRFDLNFISSNNYQNLEEWYYGDNIYTQISSESDFDQTLDKFYFRYSDVGTALILGTIFTFFTLGDSDSDSLVLFIESRRDSRNSSRDVYSDSFIEVRSLEQLPIFENEIESTNFDQDIYYEIGRTYDIDGERNHLGFDTDVSQTLTNTALLRLPIFNAFSWGNGFESYKIRDSFNAKPMFIDTRPTSVINDYKENFRIASLTYSQVFEQTTNFNGLNEFNLSLINYKDLDDKYGKLRKLHSRDTNLIVFQDDKVHNILVNKSVLFNADGSGNVSQNTNVLGQEVAYKGEYGISTNPESFATFGTKIWFSDTKRGAIMRLANDGLTEISSYGMKDYFRDDSILKPNSKKLGSYDPYFDQYVLSLGDEPEAPLLRVNCGNNILKTNQIDKFTYILNLNNLSGDVVINYNITFGEAQVVAVFNGVSYEGTTTTGVGNVTFERDTLSEDEVVISVTPLEVLSEYSLQHVCPLGEPLRVVSIIVNGEEDEGETMTSRYKWNSSPFFSEILTFEADGITLFKDETGVQGLGGFPTDGSAIQMQAYKDVINTGNFTAEADNKLSYLISDSVYLESDIDTIKSLSTELEITTQNEGGIPETDKGSFVFNRPLGTESLYLIWDYTSLAINRDTFIYIYFDNSGSMSSTEAPLEEMRDTLLQDALLPFYDDDIALYNSRVTVTNQSNERTLTMLNLNGATPVGNVVSLVFQDEARDVYHGVSFDDGVRTGTYNTDLLEFRDRLNSFESNYYRGVVFQVEPNSGSTFNQFLNAVESGTNAYSGTNGLSDRDEVIYKYNITDGGTAQYYLEQVTDALTELGFNLNPE